MNFPLDLRFKIVAIAPQISVTDAAGNLVYYVKQKAFKLREDVRVFADAEQTRELHRIAADRVLDISARYSVTDAGGNELGQVQRRGMRSLWKAHYEMHRAGGAVLEIREENGWVKVLDGLLGQVPVLGLFAGYVFNPSYVVTRVDTGAPVARITKKPALFEGLFRIERVSELNPEDETLVVLGALMMLLLERARG